MKDSDVGERERESLGVSCMDKLNVMSSLYSCVKLPYTHGHPLSFLVS